MSRIASVDTTPIDGKAGFAVAEQTCLAPGLTDAMTAAPEDLQDMLLFFGNLSVPRGDAAMRERIAHLVNAGTESGDSDARSEDSIDPKGDAARRFVRIVLEAKRNIAACELAAMRAVGWIDEEIAEIVLHVAMTAMLNTLDRFGQTKNLPRAARRVRAA